MAADRKGESWAVLAASEMGKGVWLKQHLRRTKPARLIIWDTNDEYGDHAREVGTLTELAAAVRGARFAVRYVPRSAEDKVMRREFAGFCLVAYQCIGAVVVVEELADVTSASYAPPEWRKLNTRGRHHQGLQIIFCSQSPALIDKTALTNATFFHVGFLGNARHRAAVATELGVSPEEINGLRQFDYLEYRRATKELLRGRVRLPPRRG